MLKLCFNELRDSKLSGLRTFDEFYTILMSQNRGKNQKGRLRIHETLFLEVVFLTLSESSSVVTHDTNRPREYAHDQKQL